MWHALTETTNRGLAYVALGCVVVMLGLQAMIFPIWGNDGDPPNVIVAIVSALFWGAVLVLLVVAVVGVRRRRDSRHR